MCGARHVLSGAFTRPAVCHVINRQAQRCTGNGLFVQSWLRAGRVRIPCWVVLAATTTRPVVGLWGSRAASLNGLVLVVGAC